MSPTQVLASEQVAKAQPAGGTGRRRRRRRYTNPVTVLLFLSPMIVVVGTLRIWPVYESIRLSFTNWDGVSTPKNTGMSNYRKLWHDPLFWKALENNAKLLLAVPFMVFVPLFIAALLRSRIFGWKIFRSVFFFPTLLSPAVIGLTFKLFLKEDGALNTILRVIGLGSVARVWLTDPTSALVWVVAVGIWAGIGIGVVVYLAAMGSVDTNLVDAARMDGAGWFRVQRHVVFPQILPVIELATVLSLISVFTGYFALILLMTNGGPNYSTTTADLYAYEQAFNQFNAGYSSAITVVILVITVAIVGLAFAAFSRARRDEG